MKYQAKIYHRNDLRSVIEASTVKGIEAALRSHGSGQIKLHSKSPSKRVYTVYMGEGREAMGAEVRKIEA